MLDLFGRPAAFWDVYLRKTEQLEEKFKDPTHLAEINAGADKQGGHTLLFFAVYVLNNASVIATLLKHGANISALDNMMRTPLHLAANSGDIKNLVELFNVDEAKQLVEAVDINGRTTIHAACMLAQDGESKATIEDLSQSLALLLSYCDDKEAALQKDDNFGINPLQYAKHFGFLTALADLGLRAELIDPNNIADIPAGHPSLVLDYFGRTELMIAAFVNKKDIVMAELAKGAQVTTANRQAGFRNSLHLACCGLSDAEMVNILLADLSTNPLATDCNGNMALHFTANTGRLDTTRALLVATNDDTNVVRIKNVQVIAEHVNALDLDGRTALHTAVMASSRMKVSEGEQLAERMQMIRLLLDSGINPKIRDRAGMTALELAEHRGNIEVVTALRGMLEERNVLEEPAPTCATKAQETMSWLYNATVANCTAAKDSVINRCFRPKQGV